MGETRLAFSRSYDLTIYLYAAVLYLILVETIRRIWNRLERAADAASRREGAQRRPTLADLAPAPH